MENFAHREYVGRADAFDTLGASHFTLLTMLGLREYHRLLDIGCGSLRSGRLLIPYLAPGRYFAIEPNSWLVEAGVAYELGSDAVRLKAPVFRTESDFVLTRFGEKFDYIHAHSILTHAAPRMMARLFEQVAQVLAPRGVFVGTFRLGATDYEGSEWVYPEQVEYKWETIERVAGACGLAAFRLRWPHPSQQYFLMLPGGCGLEEFLGGIDREHTLGIGGMVGDGRGDGRGQPEQASYIIRRLGHSLSGFSSKAAFRRRSLVNPEGGFGLGRLGWGFFLRRLTVRKRGD